MDNYLSQLQLILPEVALTAVALIVLVYDLVSRGRNSRHVGYITLAGLALVGWLLVGQWQDLSAAPAGTPAPVAFAMVHIDLFGTFFKLFTVVSLIVVTAFVLFDRRERKHGIGEYFFLLLGAAIGIFFMVSTNNLLLLMLGLELLSLASYSLAGFHKGDRRSAEAALKYVVFGGLSAGVMLYGISLMYGLTGTLDLVAMGQGSDAPGVVSLATQFATSPVPVAVAFVLILAGFAYKVSVVPFHFWTPDVYEGAPTPVTTFLAVASKAAGFAVLIRFVGALFLTEGVEDIVVEYGAKIGTLLAILSAVTITLGNVSAIRQSSLKRLLAYSSIAHAGYALMGLAAMSAAGVEASLFYLAAYYFMNLGAFGFLLYFEGVTGSDEISALKGLGNKAPLFTIAMIVFLVSLTGLPPTIGFYGKVKLLYACWHSGLYWLVLIALINTPISLFYYFRVAKALFLTDESEKVVKPQPLFAGLMVLLALGTIVYGLYTAPLDAWSNAGEQSLHIVQE